MTRRARRDCCPYSGEEGISILETVLALSLFALLIVGIATSAGAGLRLTGRSNARQEATQVGVRRIELLRASKYDTLGMPTGQVYESTTAGSPDFGISGGKFTVPLPNPVTEDLVDGGTLPDGHRPPDVTQGSRSFSTWQYVTWTSAAHDRKRMTVVVQWSGGAERLVFSTLEGSGKIEYGATTTSTTGSTTPSSTTTTVATTTTASVCPGDTQPPAVSSFKVVVGSGTDAVYVNSTAVKVVVNATDTCNPLAVQLSNDGGSTWGTPSAITSGTSSEVSWNIPGPDGSKTVTGRVIDGANNATPSPYRAYSFILDTAIPSAPTQLTGDAQLTQSGEKSNDLTWKNTSTDVNGFSYEIRRQIGGVGTFDKVGTVNIGNGSGLCGPNQNSCGYSDTAIGGSTTYSYRIVAVDSAGNASSPTETTTCTTPASRGTEECIAS